MLIATPVSAACPVCIVGVSGGLIIAEWLGIDDLLVAIWIMGLMCAVSFWFATWLENFFVKKEIKVPRFLSNAYFWSILMFLITVAYFIGTDKLGWNLLWGIDRLIIGSLLGTLAFFTSQILEKYLRNKNNGKAYFPYQKAILPFASLVLATIIGVVLLYIGGIF